MLLDPVVTHAERDIVSFLQRHNPQSVDAQRDLALRIDRDLVFPLVADAPPVRSWTVEVPVPGRSSVRVHLFAPIDSDPIGAYLFFFGGAFRQGGIHFPSVAALLSKRAVMGRHVVVAPDYALAPEEPFPAAFEQGRAVLRWLAEEASALGIQPEMISIGGMSAGGNIAAAVTVANRDTDRVPLRQQILEVPVTDLTGGHLSAEMASFAGLTEDEVVPMMTGLADVYLSGADPRTPEASPLFSPDLSELPPAHIFTAELDVFRGDGEAYVDALRAHGTSASEHRFDGMTHGSLAFTRDVPAAQQWERGIAELLLTEPDKDERDVSVRQL